MNSVVIKAKVLLFTGKEVDVALSHSLRERCRLLVTKQGTGQDMIQIVLEEKPDLLIFDRRLSTLSSLEALETIYKSSGAIPAIALVDEIDLEEVLPVMKDYFHACVVKPVIVGQLVATMVSVMLHYRQIHELEGEIDNLQKDLKTRKLVDRAKGILMARHHCPEAAAFRRIQKYSMDNRMDIAEVAHKIINGNLDPFYSSN